MRRLLRILFCAAAVACGLPVAIYLWSASLLPPLARWLDVGGPPRRADYVMPLPGDQQIRPFVAAALVKVGLAGAVLIPENERMPDVDEGIVPPTDEIIRRVMRCRGVPQDKIIVLPGKSGSTLDDIGMLRAFLEPREHARVAVVTSSYHTRRARWSVSHVLGPRARDVTFVSAPSPDFDMEQWWRTEAGLRRITSEYAKLFLYWMRYGTGIPCCLGGAIVVVLLTATARKAKWEVQSEKCKVKNET